MADQTNKDFAPLEACRELSKSINDLIAKYQHELSDLHLRELKKNTQEGYTVPGAEGGLAQSEMSAAKVMRPAKAVVKTMCKGCGEPHESGKHMKKGETFIDKKNDTDGVDSGEQGKRLKDIGQQTPRIPKPKKVTPKNHAEGGNDGAEITTNNAGGLNKGDVPMAKPPSGGTGLAPKAPSMAKPAPAAAPAGGMPKPPMMAKGGARMDNPHVEQGKPSLNTIAKAAMPGTMQGDMLSASHKAQAPAAAPAPAPVAAAPQKAAIKIPGRAQALADFTPAGQFTPAGAGLPAAGKFSGGMYQSKKPIALPGKGKPAPAVNPAANHLTAPPPSVRPAPARQPLGTAYPSMPQEQPKINRFGKSEEELERLEKMRIETGSKLIAGGAAAALTALGGSHYMAARAHYTAAQKNPNFSAHEYFFGKCALCSNSEHPGACPPGPPTAQVAAPAQPAVKPPPSAPPAPVKR